MDLKNSKSKQKIVEKCEKVMKYLEKISKMRKNVTIAGNFQKSAKIEKKIFQEK